MTKCVVLRHGYLDPAVEGELSLLGPVEGGGGLFPLTLPELGLRPAKYCLKLQALQAVQLNHFRFHPARGKNI